MAEREGFEPSVPCDTPVFKTGALNHYATSPSINTWFCKCIIPFMTQKNKNSPGLFKIHFNLMAVFRDTFIIGSSLKTAIYCINPAKTKTANTLDKGRLFASFTRSVCFLTLSRLGREHIFSGLIDILKGILLAYEQDPASK